MLWLVPLICCLIPQDGRPAIRKSQHNFSYKLPPGWRVAQSPVPEFHTALNNGSNMIMVQSFESQETPEEHSQDIMLGIKMMADESKEAKRDTITVDNEYGVRIIFDAKVKGIEFQYTLVCFSHQGIMYTVMAFHPKRMEREGVSESLDDFLQDFKFLNNRKDWMKKYEGKPHRFVFLGGLGEFQLNRPRWNYTNAEIDRRPQDTDYFMLTHLPGGAWFQLHAVPREKDMTPQDQLQQILFEEYAHEERVVKKKEYIFDGMSFHGLGQTSKFSETQYSCRSAWFEKDGWLLCLILMSTKSRADSVENDWQQALKTLKWEVPRHDSKPLFPLQRNTYYGSRKDTSLEPLLTPARKIQTARNHHVQSISPDGLSLVVVEQNQLQLKIGTRTPVPLLFTGNQYVTKFAWSKDGERLASFNGKSIEWINLKELGKPAKKIDLAANSGCFSPDGKSLIVSVSRMRSLPSAFAGSLRYELSSLYRVDLQSGKSAKILEFPFARIELPVLSADGSKLAFISNKNDDRSRINARHLYVSAADGTLCKQLTHTPEMIDSLAWSDDGLSIYLLRSESDAEEEYGYGYANRDLYRFNLLAGQLQNLTHCSRIDSFAIANKSVLLEISSYLLPDSQRGVFSVDLEHLEKLKPADSAARAMSETNVRKQVKEAIEKEVGSTKLRDFVPDKASLARLADVFAKAASRPGSSFDFTLQSLSSLSRLISQWQLASRPDGFLQLGISAYYGETVRRSLKAEWKIKPVPWGDQTPCSNFEFNPYFQLICPMQEIASQLHQSENGMTVSEHYRNDLPIFLVYPASNQDAVVSELIPAKYQKAKTLLNQGKAEDAMQLLLEEMNRLPKNEKLAEEVIALAKLTNDKRLPTLIENVVQGGSKVSSILLQYAEEISQKAPEKADEYYRQALNNSEYAVTANYLAYARYLKSLGKIEQAECCARRVIGQTREGDEFRAEVLELLGIESTVKDPK